MEEDKAAALYEELTRKGGGAAKFKQGLGFSSAADTPPSRGSALPSSSFMSSFVKASSPGKSKELERQSQIESIQNKLKNKNKVGNSDRNDQIRVSDRDDEVRVRVSDRDRVRRRSRSRSRERRRNRSRSRERRGSRSRSRSRETRRNRSRSRERRKNRSRSRERRRSRSRSQSRSRETRRNRSRSRERESRSRRRYRSSSRERRGDRREKRSRSRSRSRDRRRERGRSRILSPRGRKSERGRDDEGKGRVVKTERSNVVDYAKLIHGYDKMTPAERVKAKIKLQLSQTAEKDEKMGVGSQWERFDFDKDAPIEDEVLEAADDDAAVSKRINQSFRFASLEGKREDEVKNAHDEAMFGVPAPQPSQTSESDNEEKPTDDTDTVPASSLLNEKLLSKQQGSWRDRARRNVG